MPEKKRLSRTIDEVWVLIATSMKNEAVKQTYLFSCFCGLRTSDIVGLKWKDVFVDRGKYRLAVSMQNHVFDLPSLTVINALFKPWTKATGIDKWFSFHTRCHTFATTVTLTQGVPLETVSKMLGHKRITTTQIYARITNDRIGQDMAVLSEKLDSVFKFAQ